MSDNNQFTDFVKSAINPDFFLNAAKSLPMLDFSAFSNVVKKNAEALTVANQLIAESVQSIAKRSSEIVKHQATELFDTVKDVASAGDREQVNNRQRNYINSSIENSINNMKELVDVASKASLEILQVSGKNLSENINTIFDHAKTK